MSVGNPAEPVLELVVFKLRENVSHETFLATVDGVSEWAKARPGFVSRDLSYSADQDTWIDVVYWNTMQDAREAATAAESSESCAPHVLADRRGVRPDAARRTGPRSGLRPGGAAELRRTGAAAQERRPRPHDRSRQ